MNAHMVLLFTALAAVDLLDTVWARARAPSQAFEVVQQGAASNSAINGPASLKFARILIDDGTRLHDIVSQEKLPRLDRWQGGGQASSWPRRVGTFPALARYYRRVSASAGGRWPPAAVVDVAGGAAGDYGDDDEEDSPGYFVDGGDMTDLQATSGHLHRLVEEIGVKGRQPTWRRSARMLWQ